MIDPTNFWFRPLLDLLRVRVEKKRPCGHDFGVADMSGQGIRL